MTFRKSLELVLAAAALISTGALAPLSARAAASTQNYKKQAEPLIQKYCFDCHGEGMSKGEVSFDSYTNLAAHLEDRKLWLAVWGNLQSQMMPPAKKPQPSDEERRQVIKWIERDVFKNSSKCSKTNARSFTRMRNVTFSYVRKALKR